jgi:hypothetical protein
MDRQKEEATLLAKIKENEGSANAFLEDINLFKKKPDFFNYG